jgi:MoxR-like ATPase
VPDDLDLIAALEKNVARCIVGKSDVVRLAVVGLLARGHLLIEDVPGVGKTTLAAALARSIGGRFARIQFTADMLPSDVIGVSVWDAARGEFSFKQGPVFSNVILADEINRTTPKTQSSLLEAMNEAQVSLDHTTHALPSPFMVLATQNPREYEGTFALPESQLDRFLLRVRIGYPDPEDEKAILRGAAAAPDTLAAALELEDVRRLQALADTVRVADLVLDYVMALVAATRDPARLALGVSPRGARALVAAARAAALTEGRDYVLPDDVKRLAVAALAHRVVPRGADAGGADTESVVRAIVQDIAVPR